MALRYKAVTKRKESINLHEVLERKKEKDKKKKTKRDSENVNGFKYPVWYPIFDHCSPNQLSQLIMSLERTLSTLQERLRFAEAQKQRRTNLVHQNLTPSLSSLNQKHHQYQTQPLNPSQYSLYMCNHGDATLSQLPLSASLSNQLINYQNHLMMQQKLHGFGQNITNRNFQHPCVSNTQALLSVQESELMRQQGLYGSRQNMCMMNDISNSNPCLSNRAPDELFSDFQKNRYGDMVGSTSFSQEFPDSLSGFLCQKAADKRD